MTAYTLRDGSTVTDPRLNRTHRFDERSKQYRVSAVLPQSKPVTKMWTIPGGAATEVLDQGVEGACCGFGVTNELRFRPVPVNGLDDVFAREKIYWLAQHTDSLPGGSYPGADPRYEGTSVLDAVKAAQTLGYYTEFRWAMSEPEMCLGVGYLGPAIIGVDWYQGMFTPDTGGYLHRTGGIAGGHCILVKGVNVRSGFYTVYNSWGPGWGDHGTAKISRPDMAALLAADGECCIITGRARPL